jgi:hypothetical protein
MGKRRLLGVLPVVTTPSPCASFAADERRGDPRLGAVLRLTVERIVTTYEDLYCDVLHGRRGDA